MVNFSGIPQDSVVGRMLRWPLQLIPDGVVVPVLQGPLRGARWVVGAGTHGCWLGSYEYHKQRELAKTLRPGQVFYDIGANAGFYTLLASRLVGSEGHVVAVEPLPRNLHYLRRHLTLNKTDNVTVVDAAAASVPGYARFDAKPTPSMGRLSPQGGLVVRTFRLEALLDDGLPPPDVIKMDIEGGEVDALKGAEGLLGIGRATRPTIFLATHGPSVHQEACELLDDFGYVIEPLDAQLISDATELVASTRSGS